MILKWYEGGGENGITSNRIFQVVVFFSSQNIDFSFYLKRLLELFFPSLFFMLRLLRTWRFWWYLRRKSVLQKHFFKWPQYTGGGRIFWNGVMHANMAKPWLWRWGSCEYIGSGRIFQSGGMHANIYLGEASIFLVANHFRKVSKLKWTHPLTKLNTNKSRYADNIWL
jgi:hypothetical protein